MQHALEQELDGIVSTVRGRSAVMLRGAGWSYARRADEPMPAASIIKILIAVEAFRHAADGRIDADEPLDVDAAYRSRGTGVLARMTSVGRVSLRDLVTLMIIVSDNTATNFLIDLVGMDRINAGARELGLAHTVLQRRMMDFGPLAQGRDNLCSAADTCALLEKVAAGDVLEATHREALLYSLAQQQFNEKLPAGFPHGFPGELPLAHKTGEITGVENDAGILDAPGGPVYVAVLLADLASNRHGREAMARLGEVIHRSMLQPGTA